MAVPNDETSRTVDQTTDGGYIVTSTTYSFGNQKALLVKTGASGNVEWSKVYGGIYDQNFSFVKQLPDGNYLCAGDIFSAGAGLQDIVAKVDDRRKFTMGKDIRNIW